MKKNILITGNPGVGKTTLVQNIVKRLGAFALSGFLTEEIREDGKRVGFRAVTLNGSAAVFAHQDFRTDPSARVARYGVRPEILELLVLPHLEPERKRADLVIIDEIARMELISDKFKQAVERLLDSPCPVLATVAAQGTGFTKRVKVRDDVEVVTISANNRQALEEHVYRRILGLLKAR